jgi:hypothetical protein
MSIIRALLGLVLVSFGLFGASARADISPPPPFHFHVGRIASVADRTTVPHAEARAAVEQVHRALYRRTRELDHCITAGGGFSWRDYDTHTARVRIEWDRSAAPTETRIVSSDFARHVDACIEAILPTLTLATAPTGRIAMTITFLRDEEY